MYYLRILLISLLISFSLQADTVDPCFLQDLDAFLGIEESKLEGIKDALLYSTYSPMCAYKWGKKLFSIIDTGDIVSDKLKHCSLSCSIAQKCTHGNTFILGVAKELKDLGTAGCAEWGDEKANINGIKIAKKMRMTYEDTKRSISECVLRCEKIYVNVETSSKCPGYNLIRPAWEKS